MAVNYYGSCTGSSAKKYNLWLSISQNSQSIASNTSNVTVKLCVKRNDGYAASAYNLNEEKNSVKLTVNGTQRVNKNLEIDTRNSATVVLASWTGDVPHNSDGTLSLPVSGTFTMGTTGLSGGSVSGAFKCNTIPRASSLAFSSSTVNPGDSVTATITSATSNFTHKIQWSVGNESTSVTLASGVLSSKITVPVSWVKQIPNSASGKISVSLITYNGTQKIGTKSYTLNFTVPASNEYKPSFDIKLTRIDNGVPVAWGEYIKGISRLKVELENIDYKYGAGYSAVLVNVGGIKKQSVPAVYDLVSSGSVQVAVGLKDTRGMVTIKTTTITVADYSPPSVSIKALCRCDESGATDTNGTSLLLDYGVGFSSINGKNSYTVTVKYKQSDEAIYSSEQIVTECPVVIGTGNIAFNSSYSVAITVKDDITTDGVEIMRSVPSGAIPFNIRKGGNGAAFGGYAENENELRVKWNLKVDGNTELMGELNRVRTRCEATELAEVVYSDVRYYPCFNMVFLRMKLKCLSELSGGVTHHVACVPEYIPTLFSPLSSFVDVAQGGQSNGAIFSSTGDIVFRGNVTVPEGTMIYINGSYILS